MTAQAMLLEDRLDRVAKQGFSGLCRIQYRRTTPNGQSKLDSPAAHGSRFYHSAPPASSGTESRNPTLPSLRRLAIPQVSKRQFLQQPTSSRFGFSLGWALYSACVKTPKFAHAEMYRLLNSGRLREICCQMRLGFRGFVLVKQFSSVSLWFQILMFMILAIDCLFFVCLPRATLGSDFVTPFDLSCR